MLLTRENPADGASAFQLLKIRFCEEVFGEGQELLILVTELTISYYGANFISRYGISYYGANFISRYGCEEYFAHNEELLFYERQKAIIEEMEGMEV